MLVFVLAALLCGIAHSDTSLSKGVSINYFTDPVCSRGQFYGRRCLKEKEVEGEKGCFLMDDMKPNPDDAFDGEWKVDKKYDNTKQSLLVSTSFYSGKPEDVLYPPNGTWMFLKKPKQDRTVVIVRYFLVGKGPSVQDLCGKGEADWKLKVEDKTMTQVGVEFYPVGACRSFLNVEGVLSSRTFVRFYQSCNDENVGNQLIFWWIFSLCMWILVWMFFFSCFVGCCCLHNLFFNIWVRKHETVPVEDLGDETGSEDDGDDSDTKADDDDDNDDDDDEEEEEEEDEDDENDDDEEFAKYDEEEKELVMTILEMIFCVPLDFIHSIFFIILITLRESIGLFGVIISIFLLQPDHTSGEYQRFMYYLEKIQTICVCIVLFNCVFDFVVILVLVGRHICFRFHICMIYACYQDNIFFRYQRILLSIFLTSGELSVYAISYIFGGDYGPIQYDMNSMEGIGNCVGVVLPFILMVFTVQGIIESEGAGSIAQCKTMWSLPFKDLLMSFPRVKIGVFDLLDKSPGGIVTDVLLVLSVMQHNKERKREEIKDDLAFRHLKWPCLEGMKHSEVEYLANLLFVGTDVQSAMYFPFSSLCFGKNEEDEEEEDKRVKIRKDLNAWYLDNVAYLPPLSTKWCGLWCCGYCVLKKEYLKKVEELEDEDKELEEEDEESKKERQGENEDEEKKDEDEDEDTS